MQILSESSRLQIAEAFVHRDSLRAARASADEQRVAAAKAASEKQQITTGNRREAAYHSEWDRNLEEPTAFPEPSRNSVHYSEEYGATSVLDQSRVKNHIGECSEQEKL